MNSDSYQDPGSEKSAPSFLGDKRIFQSKELFKNQREIVIVHGEAYYRLQITKAGKLILNK